MPRKKRQESVNGVYHWIVRGMNRKPLFHQAEDIGRLKGLLFEYKKAFGIDFYHYCFMTNHLHLLLRTETLKQLSAFSHYVQRRYAYYYCGKYKWMGSVFQRSYRSFPIERDEYLIECGRYIERNPLKAKIVKNVEDYEYSSFRYYSLGQKDDLITPSPAYLGLAADASERQRTYRSHVTANRIQEEMMERGLLSV